MRTTILIAIIASFVAQPLQARTWTDKSGKYSIEAELFAFNESHVILQRTDRKLGMVEIENLSEDDRKFLASGENAQLSDANLSKKQTWTMRNGYRVVGQMVDYNQVELEIQRRRGKVYVNDRRFSKLPKVYQVIVLRYVEETRDVELPSETELEKWLMPLKGAAAKFTVPGVVLELEDENEYSVPFELFSDDSLAILKPGWDEWIKAKNDAEARAEESFRAQASAAAARREKEIDRRIAIANIRLNAVQSGLTSIWEVTIYPKTGVNKTPLWVVESGRTSEVAKAKVLMQYPDYTPGSIRKVSGSAR